MMTVAEAANYLRVTKSEVKRILLEGLARTLKIGTHTLVDLDEVEKALRESEALIDMKEAMELTGLTYSAIRRGIEEGWIPCIRTTGRRYRFRPGELLKSIENRMQ